MPTAAGGRRDKAVLVVDDDPCTLETTALLLRSLGLQVHQAKTGAEALTLARTRTVDLALLDQRLPDMTGLAVARALRQDGIRLRWILMSGFMNFELATEAGRLGAVASVSSPFDVSEVVSHALDEAQYLGTRLLLEWPTLPLRPRLRNARSAAERWARMVLLGCDAAGDLSTIGLWASAAAVGRSTLRGICDMVGVAAHDARDFTRVLRALTLCDGRIEDVEGHLLVGDPKTMERLLRRAALVEFDSGRMSPDTFITHQHFFSPDRPVIRALCALMTDLADL